MKGKAYYANGKHQRSGRNPRGVRVTSCEWITIKEDTEPAPEEGKVLVVDQIREGDSHRIRKVLRAKTTEELQNDTDNAASKSERDQMKAVYTIFNSGNATNIQIQRAIAYLIRHAL